jgi:hypothetical protein
MAHDELGLGEMGDIVRIVPSRPMSRKKRHVLKDIIRKAPKLDLSGSGDGDGDAPTDPSPIKKNI